MKPPNCPEPRYELGNIYKGEQLRVNGYLELWAELLPKTDVFLQFYNISHKQKQIHAIFLILGTKWYRGLLTEGHIRTKIVFI